MTHGFVRNKKGTITSFDAPDAGTGNGQGTSGNSINTAGDITGNYFDASNVGHGFVRTPYGWHGLLPPSFRMPATAGIQIATGQAGEQPLGKTCTRPFRHIWTRPECKG